MRIPPLAAAAVALFAADLPAQTPYRVGEPLLDLRLPTIDSERTVRLAEFRGRRLLLIEFAAW